MTVLGHSGNEVVCETERRRCFTLSEANRALVFVKRVVADIVVDYSRLLDLHEVMEAASAAGALEQAESARDELLQVAERLRVCLEELEDAGVDLIDWAKGIVAFPCLIDGREVCLCWEYGQKTVTFWHEVCEGAEGRKPIASLPTRAHVPVES